MEIANVQTLAGLQASPEYRCEKAVPVFRPHTRYMMGLDGRPTDRVKYVVSEEDLQEICDNSNAAILDDCHFPRQTIGHISFKGVPETKQPAEWNGYAVNYRVGMMPNGKQVILADLYTHNDYWEKSRKYPYRSSEYNWKSKKISGVARILRDPALGLGTTPYQDDENSLTCYAEVVMEPQAGTPGAMNAGDLNPDEAVMADRLWAYFVAKNPGMSQLAAAAPSGTNGGLPEADQKPEPDKGRKEQEAESEEEDEEDEEEEEKGKEKKAKKKKPEEESDVSKNNDTPTVEAYAALEGQVKAKDQTIAELRAEIEKGKVNSLLDTLSDVEKYEFDRDEEFALMLPMSEDARKKRADSIRKHNKQKDSETVDVLHDTGGVKLHDGKAASGMDAARYDRVMRHFLANKDKGCTWQQALSEVK